MKRLLGIALLLAAACASTTAGLDGTEWKLIGSTATIKFADGSATGTGGCNQYRATYSTSGNALDLGPAMATKRACLDPAMNVAETAYFDALTKVETFEVTDTRLILRDASNSTLLEFGK